MAPYDPTIYLGSARHYVNGRPGYSAALVPTLVDELGLDGTGRLLDVGCGPGVLALLLAPVVAEVVGLDGDAEMLAVAGERAAAQGVGHVRWVQAPMAQVAELGLGRFGLVTFGQSLHWTDREVVAEQVYDLLEPGGAIVLVVHTVEGRPAPPPLAEPPIPHDEIRALVERYLGPERRAGQGPSPTHPDRFEDALGRTRFGRPRVLFAPGRPDLVRDIDSVVDGMFSMSWSAPHLYGDRRDAFEADLRALLREHAPDGRFHDWPGDTEILIATKAG